MSVEPFRNRVAAGKSLPLALRRGRVVRGRPSAPAYVEYDQTWQEGFRIEDTTLAKYELYVGENALPDFDASGQPVATSATLPFSWTPSLPSSGNATFYCVVRYRNHYNLESFNIFATTLVYKVHVAALNPISPPIFLNIYDGATGLLRVVSKYLIAPDVPSPADTFQIYAKLGSDPVPGVDIPVYSGAMVVIGSESGLAQTIGGMSGWVPGVVAHVIVAVKRTADGALAWLPVTLHTLIGPPNLVNGFIFGAGQLE